ncbi:MAG TPA: DUF2339 domain-containing protein, partial [Ignavibacteriaceae bacterium]
VLLVQWWNVYRLAKEKLLSFSSEQGSLLTGILIVVFSTEAYRLLKITGSSTDLMAASLAFGPILFAILLLKKNQFMEWMQKYLGDHYQEIVILNGLAISTWILWAAWTQPILGSYIPLLNVIELVSIAGFYLLVQRWNQSRERDALFYIWFILIGGVILNGLMARGIHHGMDIPYRLNSLWKDGYFQFGLTGIWTSIWIGLMIWSTKIGERTLWKWGMGGLSLVGIKLMVIDVASKGTLAWTLSLMGVAFMVLLASRFAPVPPERK